MNMRDFLSVKNPFAQVFTDIKPELDIFLKNYDKNIIDTA